MGAGAQVWSWVIYNFPLQGSHLPLLCIGTEHLRTNNLSLAEQFIRQAASLVNTRRLYCTVTSCDNILNTIVT